MVAALADVLTRTIASVDALADRAAAAAGVLADGSLDDIHAVMVAMREANQALHVTIQVRTQLLEAYRDLAQALGPAGRWHDSC